jgi:hypothetical protein
MATLTGPQIKEETDRLMTEEVVLDLAREARSGFPGNGSIEAWLDQCELRGAIFGASKEYHSRGGKSAITIGGPWRAVRMLITKGEA